MPIYKFTFVNNSIESLWRIQQFLSWKMIPRIAWNPNICCYAQKSQPLVPVVNQMKIVDTLTCYLLQVLFFIIIFPYTSRHYKWSLRFKIPDKNTVGFSYSYHASYMSYQFHPHLPLFLAMFNEYICKCTISYSSHGYGLVKANITCICSLLKIFVCFRKYSINVCLSVLTHSLPVI